MKNYVFNEKESIEEMIKHNFVDQDNPTYTINKLARYNHYILGLSQKQNYNEINAYMVRNCDIYTEIGYYREISRCIKGVTKTPWKEIREISVTANELERIKLLRDDRKEKLAFVLLADAKYDGVCNGSQCDVSFLSTSDLYRFSRVTMPIKERNAFLGFLYDENLVKENFNPKFTGKQLLYTNYDSEPELVLTENNYKELAFTYMNWKYGGYKECKQCGRLFKAKTNGQYCKNCLSQVKKEDFKTIKCIDCGIDVIVKQKNTKSCRCDDCQNEENKRIKREWWSSNK